MRIGLDLDNCIADLWGSALPHATEMLGVSVDLEDIVKWEMWECMGVTRDEFVRFHDECLSGAVVVRPVLGAIPGVKTLESEGHDVTVVTARPDEFAAATFAWLSTHGMDHIPLVTGATDKSAAGPWGAFVDDNLDTCMLLSQSVELVLLFDRPWNRCESLPGNIRRVRTWDAVLDTIRGHIIDARDR